MEIKKVSPESITACMLGVLVTVHIAFTTNCIPSVSFFKIVFLLVRVVGAQSILPQAGNKEILDVMRRK